VKGEMVSRVPVVMGSCCRMFFDVGAMLDSGSPCTKAFGEEFTDWVVCCQCLHSSESRQYFCLKLYPRWWEARFDLHCDCTCGTVASEDCFHGNSLDS